MSFLKIKNLSVDYPMRKETVYAAKDVNIEVDKGEILGLVGESGSGKSTVGNAIINLIDAPGKVSSGSVILGDLNIHDDPNNIVKYRGKKIGQFFFLYTCLLYTSPSPRDGLLSRMPSSA